MDIWAFLHRFRWDWALLVPILAADAAGMAFGWYYYADAGQFVPGDLDCSDTSGACTPWWLWWLVADSPNAVLVIVVAILLHRVANWRHRVLDAFAFALNIYVGLWTTMLFLSYPTAMGTFSWGSTNNILFLTHMGMPLQALTLTHLMRGDHWKWKEALAVVAALALFVVVDYWGPHLHPAPFLHTAGDEVVGWGGDAWLALASSVLMGVAAAAFLALARPWRKR